MCLYYVLTVYGSDTRPVKEEDEIKLKKNDARIVRWICDVRSEDFGSGTLDQTKFGEHEGTFIEQKTAMVWSPRKKVRECFIDPPELVVVSPEDDLGKHGEMIQKKGKSTRTQLKTEKI